MARVRLRDTWYVPFSPDELRAELLRFLRKRRMQVVDEEDGEFATIRAEQGSQLWTRLLGGWFVSATRLPKRATLTFSATTKGTVLRAGIEESLGFGILDPLLAGKYKNYFEEWMQDLEDALRLDPRAAKPDDSFQEKPKKRTSP